MCDLELFSKILVTYLKDDSMAHAWPFLYENHIHNFANSLVDMCIQAVQVYTV